MRARIGGHNPEPNDLFVGRTAASPRWEQVRRLIATLNTGWPGHIRDPAIILLLAVYGVRIGEVCALRLEDLDWANEKIRVRRPKIGTAKLPIREKGGIFASRGRNFYSLQCGLTRGNRELAGIFRDYAARVASTSLHFRLCGGERVRFEPVLEFCHAKPRSIRKLQIAQSQQRIS